MAFTRASVIWPLRLSLVRRLSGTTIVQVRLARDPKVLMGFLTLQYGDFEYLPTCFWNKFHRSLSETMKARASRNAREAFRAERARTQQFDAAAGACAEPNASEGEGEGECGKRGGDHEQPSIFRGTLKGYQLKGMNWLANLYDQVRLMYIHIVTPVS